MWIGCQDVKGVWVNLCEGLGQGSEVDYKCEMWVGKYVGEKQSE